MKLSKRASLIGPSPTLGITAKAKKMQAEGIDVIGFGAGEPDFDTPENIKDAAKKAIDAGFTKYTPTSGIHELKAAICEKLKRDNSLDYSPEEVLVSCGAKHSIFNAILAMCDEMDEVVLPAPYWVSYPEMIKLAGARAIIVKTMQQNGLKITAEQLSNEITPETKLFILNSPSNPTGMAYSKEELKSIAEVLVDDNIYCLSDEIYEKITYGGVQHVSIASMSQEMKNLTIVVNGVSKPYSMTGWRIGYAAGPKEIIQVMSNIQDHSTSNPPSISQKAALEALTGPQEKVGEMVKAFAKRRDYIVKRLNSIAGIECLTPEGAFYAFPNVSQLYGKRHGGKMIKDSFSLTELLLEQARVAVVPGAVFGSDEHLRFSYATSMENIEKGMDRIEEFMKKIKG
ncbi:MAG: pyridoxal phosphate-dependent aminotransferase [Candidatus Hadarchaeota archaeon]